ncbi:hypothetical protein Brsp01_52700 [Brucella sp. NBRC 12950]|nr:hypothetical protein Brsp01_52700 [Brucella sp. NBRC 12950]
MIGKACQAMTAHAVTLSTHKAVRNNVGNTILGAVFEQDGPNKLQGFIF